jgi:hypothetical protein
MCTNRHTKLTKKNDSSTSSSKRPVTDAHAKAMIESNMKRISQLASVYAGMMIDSEDEISEPESDEEEFYRGLDRGNAFVAFESAEPSIQSDIDGDTSSNDEPFALCLMAKVSRDQVSSKHQKSIDLNTFSPENVAYAKLVKIAKSQQDALKRLEKNLKKLEGLLVEEMEKNQELIEEHEALFSTLNDLSNRYNSLLVDYVSLLDDLLSRNQEL